MRRCICGGLYEPGRTKAGEDGFRTDVLGLIRNLKMPVQRHTKGNFVSGYRREDGAGPKEKRPTAKKGVGN